MNVCHVCMYVMYVCMYVMECDVMNVCKYVGVMYCGM